MSTLADLLADLRAWLLAACSGLADGALIISEEKGTRPALPYLTLKVLADDVPLGPDEDVYAVTAGTPPDPDALSVAETGVRTGTASVQGFGNGSRDWLIQAGFLRLPAGAAVLDAAGLTVRALGGVREISRFLDTSIEPRFVREFEFSYRATSDAVAIDSAGTTSTTDDSELRRYDDDPDPLPFSLSEPLEP